MTLADDVRRELPAMRREAEALMTDAGVMRRPTGRSTQNSDGEEEPLFEDVFTSPCKIQGPSAASSDTTGRRVEIGGVERVVIEAGLHLPVSKPDTGYGWVFEVTSVGALSDLRLLGKKFFVVDDPAKSAATSRRLNVVEV